MVREPTSTSMAETGQSSAVPQLNRAVEVPGGGRELLDAQGSSGGGFIGRGWGELGGGRLAINLLLRSWLTFLRLQGRDKGREGMRLPCWMHTGARGVLQQAD